MEKFLLSNKKPILTALLVAFIAYLIYRYGKSAGGFVPLPGDGGAVISQADAQQVRETSLKIKQDIYGVNVWSRDTEAYISLSQFSDTMFVACCNDYKSQTGKSLREDINAEYYTFSGGFSFSGVITVILSRMDRLNIQ